MAGLPTYLDTDRITQIPVSVATPLPVTIDASGAANSLTNPIFVANAEAGDTTGTFTNGTQTTSVTATNCDGYATALVSINGTYGTATAVFEASDDGGTTWYSIGGARSDGLVAQTGYTSQTNATLQWACPVSGNDSFRVRSTAVASGTVNVRISVSSIVTIPSTSVVSGAGPAGATTIGNPVFVGAWNGAATFGILCDGNGRIITAGGSANGSAVVGAPNLTAGYDGTTVRTLLTDASGRQVLAPFSKTNITTGTTTLVKSGAGILHAIVVGTPVASATIKFYDGLTAVNIFSTMTLGSVITGIDPMSVTYDVAFTTGLTIVTSGATDITVSWS